MKKKKPSVSPVAPPPSDSPVPEPSESPPKRESSSGGGNDGLFWEDIADDYSDSILSLSPASFKKALRILAERETDPERKALYLRVLAETP